MKECKWCGEPKELDEYYKRSDTRDGHFSHCKACHTKYGARWFKENAEKTRGYRFTGYWLNRDDRTRRAREARRGKPDAPRDASAKSAKDKVYRAVKLGRLVRPGSCPRCSRSDVPIQAHHADYSKPLDVEWLCKWCHEAEHHDSAALQQRPAA